MWYTRGVRCGSSGNLEPTGEDLNRALGRVLSPTQGGRYAGLVAASSSRI